MQVVHNGSSIVLGLKNVLTSHSLSGESSVPKGVWQHAKGGIDEAHQAKAQPTQPQHLTHQKGLLKLAENTKKHHTQDILRILSTLDAQSLNVAGFGESSLRGPVEADSFQTPLRLMFSV